MTYTDNFSPDAAREHQQDQRLGGILEFDNRVSWWEGPAAIHYGSGTSIEFDLDGANFLIHGSKVGAPSNSVTLSDGDDTLWRTDHIYVSEDGAFNVLEGEPDDNLYAYPEIDASAGTVEWNVGENTQAGGPAPKGQAFDRKRGELIFSILVPPGATTADDFSSQHILDRRRPAIDLLNTGRPRTPAISSEYFELEQEEWEMWALPVWAGHTLRLWDYSLSQFRHGYFTSNNFKVYLVDYAKWGYDSSGTLTPEWNGGDVDWDKIAVWSSSNTRQRPDDDGDAIVDIDLPSSGVDTHAFVVQNTSDQFTYVNERGLTLSVTYTIEDTSDL